jgi:hypothetical protein
MSSVDNSEYRSFQGAVGGLAVDSGQGRRGGGRRVEAPEDEVEDGVHRRRRTRGGRLEMSQGYALPLSHDGSRDRGVLCIFYRKVFRVTLCVGPAYPCGLAQRRWSVHRGADGATRW